MFALVRSLFSSLWTVFGVRTSHNITQNHCNDGSKAQYVPTLLCIEEKESPNVK